MAISTQSPYALALSDQMNQAEKYYSSKAGVAIVQNGMNNLYKIINPSSSSDVIVDKTENKQTNHYLGEEFLDLKVDIYPNGKNKNIKPLQKQLGLEETGVYNQALVKIVKQLQTNKGLNPTGIIDRNTWFSIYDQPLDWKVKTVNLARESWKSIVEKHSTHENPLMIVVNIPSMNMYVYRKKETGYELLMESRVVVGRNKTQTPLDDFELISLKYNPNWTPTKNILKRNLYKNGEINYKWIEDHGLVLVDESGAVRDYSELGSFSNPRFVQPSGEANALGNLKFETSSTENIYMHDTNERHLFGSNTRAYSSGCVRIKEYVTLASIVSEKKSDYIQKNIGTKKMFFEKLPRRVPVYFDYSQVHFSANGDMRFFADIYNQYPNKK